ncbi:MAG: hypothetical protein E6556_11875 [Pantoea sp.]|uniref:hypothetical protein n=1 Tax=Mixta calida TaxID=665913 RepID=UPI002901015C|nr:hypothetical protein [Mixta calida]MDU6433563.1 hypothetical protein [Pantoea sp.]
MNTVMMTPLMVPPVYPQPQKRCHLYDVARCPVHTFAPVVNSGKADNGDVSPAPTLPEPGLSDTVLRPGEAMPGRSALALQRQAEAQEKLIREAETALASQSVSTYRRWYARWRRRGVRVNDLLDMTWVWRQRYSE